MKFITRQQLLSTLVVVYLGQAVTTVTCFSTRLFRPAKLPPSWTSQRVPSHLHPNHHHHHSNNNHVRIPLLSSSSLSNDKNDRARPASSSSRPSPPSPLLTETSRALRRLSWFSWWSQVILTTVSTVTLGFARNVLSSSPRNAGHGLFFLAGSGIVMSALSIVWTWANGWRLTRRLLRPHTTPTQAARLLERAIRIGVTCNSIGLALNLLGAEQIVGVLAIKVLTNWNASPGPLGYGLAAATSSVGGGWVQPLDILIVQGNTNLLLSHFVSMMCLLLLTRQVDKLMMHDGMDVDG